MNTRLLNLEICRVKLQKASDSQDLFVKRSTLFYVVNIIATDVLATGKEINE